MDILKMESANKMLIIPIVILTVLTITLGLIQVGLPGLYMDAATRDYVVAIFTGRYRNDFWFFLFPFLGQPYNNHFTWVLGSPVYWMLGTSMFTLRLMNSIYLAACVVMVFIASKAILKKTWIPFFMCLVLATSLTALIVVRTQFHVMQPGAALLIAAFYLLSRENPNITRWGLVLSGLMAGLAFYSYFVFLFFVPVLLIMAFFVKSDQNMYKPMQLFCWSLGFVIGASLYIVGYYYLFLRWIHPPNATMLRNIGIIILFLLLGAPLYLVFSNKTKITDILKRIYIVFIVLVTLLAAVVIVNGFDRFWSLLQPMISPLIVRTDAPLNLAERVERVLSAARGIVDNVNIERMVLGMNVTRGMGMLMRVFLAANALSVIFSVSSLLKKNKEDYHLIKIWAYLWAMKMSFMFFCLFFASGIGAHHFPPVFFISFISTGVAIQIILNGTNKLFGSLKWQQAILCALLVSVLMLNIGNLRRFHGALYETGGAGMFTEEINNLASDALERQRTGVREIYFFPEWGFMKGFAFLTGSNIRYFTRADVERLRAAGVSHDYIRLPVWNRNQLELYLPLFREAELHYEIVEHVSRNGRIAFFSIVGWGS